jgi:tRNA(fMet)-specific endonuclease VapC
VTFLLDTDTFSAIAMERSPAAAQRLHGVAESDAAISVVTLAELRFGMALKPLHARTVSRIEALLQLVRQLPLGLGVAAHYAQIRTHLQRSGTPIGPNDAWIAAHALAEDLTLVSSNVREFRRVPTLRLENWTG